MADQQHPNEKNQCKAVMKSKAEEKQDDEETSEVLCEQYNNHFRCICGITELFLFVPKDKAIVATFVVYLICTSN